MISETFVVPLVETQRNFIGYDHNVGPSLLDQQYVLILRVQP